MLLKKEILNNITIIGVNYYPEDSAIGLYTTQKAEFLASNGYNVSVITGFPYYPQWKIRTDYENKNRWFKEILNGVTVYRYKQYVPFNPSFTKRIVHLLSFTIGSFFNLFKIEKPQYVICIVPFTSSILLGWFLKLRFKAKLWIHVQDFEFDAALQTGVGKNKNIFFSLLFKLEKWLFSKANLASTISFSMQKRLSHKTESEQFFLPNWIDEEKINPDTAKPHSYLQSDKIKILYSGNIGDKQDWDVFIKFCKAIDSNKYEIIVVGDGAKKDSLIKDISNFNNVYYYPPVPYEELSDLLCSADVHILFQKPDVIDTVMPSKVLGMMASAKPSIIIGNPKSEVKSIFEASEAGLYSSKYSEGLIEGLNDLTKNQEDLVCKGRKARAYVIENFSKQKILSNMLIKLKAL